MGTRGNGSVATHCSFALHIEESTFRNLSLLRPSPGAEGIHILDSSVERRHFEIGRIHCIANPKGRSSKLNRLTASSIRNFGVSDLQWIRPISKFSSRPSARCQLDLSTSAHEPRLLNQL